MKIRQAVLKLWSRHENCYTQTAIIPKVGKPELRFMCSAHRLMVFNVCVKFHENMSSDFKVMEKTRKLLTDTNTRTHRERERERERERKREREKRRKLTPPMAYFVCRVYKKTSKSAKYHLPLRYKKR